MTRRATRFVSAAAAMTAGALLLAGCAAGATPDGSAEAGDPVDGGVLRVAFWPDNAAFACVDPYQTYWAEHRTVVRNVAESLTDQDPDTGEIVPWLATEWTVNDDATEYTFTLREDVTFSDGEPLTPEVVKLAFDNAQQTGDEVPGTFGRQYTVGYAGTDVVDDSTVRVRFSQPNAAFLQASSTTNLAILSPASYDKTPEERCLGDIVGSGPFVLDSYTPGERTVLSRREGNRTWSSPLQQTRDAHLDGIEFTYVAEDSVRVGQLASGEIDVAWPRAPFTEEQVAQLRSADASVASRPQAGVAASLFVNAAEDAILSDPVLRRALQRAIDRTTFATTIYGDDFEPITSVFNGTTPLRVEFDDELAYDPEGVAESLDDAGWTIADDGIREKDGRRLTLSVPVTAATPGYQLLQDQLADVGIDLELAVITAAQRSEVISSGSYDLIETYYSRADPSVLQSLLDTRVTTSLALAQNAAPAAVEKQLQADFDVAQAATDAAERAAVFERIQRTVLVDEAIVVPIYERVNTIGTGPQAHGLRLTSEAFGDFADAWVGR